jgi:hypothetical protein
VNAAAARGPGAGGAAGILFIALTAPAATARADDPAWELSFEAGAQVDPQPFGVANATLRRDNLTLRLLTDTVEAEVGDRVGPGRFWVKGRVQAFASQLLIGPWEDGEPAPERALVSPHVGAEAGWVFELPEHTYAGAAAFFRWFWFFAGPDNDEPAPESTYWFSPEAFVGWWRGPDLRAELRAGFDLHEGLTRQEPFVGPGQRQLAPKVRFEAVLVPPGTALAPRVEVYAGWARDQGRLVRTRLGGLNPYVVPLAGAGWAEFLVEEYAVVRVGPNLRWDGGEAAVVADLATFDGEEEVTFAFLGHLDFDGGWFVDASVGYAPFIERASGVLRTSAWLLAGRGFQPF